MTEPASRTESRWAMAALILGATGLLGACFLNHFLFRWLVWDLHQRPLYGMLEPWVPFVLPAFALIAGAVALLRGGPRRRAGLGIALALAAMAAAVTTGRASTHARELSCRSNVKQLTLALQMYAEDHDGWLPPADDWARVTHPYTKNLGILCCPSDYASDPRGTRGAETSYTMNAHLSRARVADIADPARTPLLFEGGPTAGGPDAAAFRHRGGLNVGCADWHAEWVSREEFMAMEVRP